MKIQAGDVALITGASRGLGLHIARVLAERGMKLVLAARSPDLLTEAATSLQSTGVEVLTVATDVEDAKQLARLADAAHARFGRVDVLVNNAGIEYAVPFDHVNAEDIARNIAVNLTAPIALTRLLLPGMLERGRGHIVNIASAAGLMASPYEELYIASKHGLVGFTRALRTSAQDMQWPVSASAISPGFMEGAGMYENTRRKHGVQASPLVGSIPAQALGKAVIRAIEKDLPDVILMPGAPRLLAGLQVMAPRLYEYILRKTDSAAFFRSVGLAHRDERMALGAPPR